MFFRNILFLILFYSNFLFAGFIEKTGDFIQIIIPISAYTSTFIAKDNDGRFDFYKTALSTFALTELLKNTVQELRPDKRDTRSFPSGHTSVSFMGASFIHFRYGLKKAIPFYLLASFVGFSRIYANRHYFHDVLASAIIGFGFSYLFVKKYKSISLKPIAYKYNKDIYYGIIVDW